MKHRMLTLPLSALLAVTALGFASGCENRLAMHDQPRFEPLEGTDFFPDQRSSRPPPEGTIARGQLQLDAHLHQGLIGDKWATELPMPITAEVLARGQERFNIFCSVCHGESGYGNGMIVQRGFKIPPSYHTDRLRAAPAGYLFDVITNGFGAMYDYSMQIKPEDRWAIVAYIRALQLSQHAQLTDVPEAERHKLLEELP